MFNKIKKIRISIINNKNFDKNIINKKYQHNIL